MALTRSSYWDTCEPLLDNEAFFSFFQNKTKHVDILSGGVRPLLKQSVHLPLFILFFFSTYFISGCAGSLLLPVSYLLADLDWQLSVFSPVGLTVIPGQKYLTHLCATRPFENLPKLPFLFPFVLTVSWQIWWITRSSSEMWLSVAICTMAR